MNDWKVDLLGPDDAAQLADEIRAMYRTAFSASHWDKSELGITAFENDIFPRHLKREGFAMTSSRNAAGELIGFCYGYIGEHGQYWTDYVAARIHPVTPPMRIKSGMTRSQALRCSALCISRGP